MTEKQRLKALDGIEERMANLIIKYRIQKHKIYHPTKNMDKAEVGL